MIGLFPFEWTLIRDGLSWSLDGKSTFGTINSSSISKMEDETRDSYMGDDLNAMRDQEEKSKSGYDRDFINKGKAYLPTEDECEKYD